MRAGGAALHAVLYAALYTGRYGGLALFAGGVGGAEEMEVRRSWRCGGVGGAEELVVPEVIRCVLLCMLEAVEGKLCLWSCWRCRRCRR